ncbi:MAG: hypothetical protein PVI77_08570, partial [Desulfobacterales bacterium]
MQKPEGFRVKAFEGESSRESAGLRALSNAESEVLRLSLRVNNMAKNNSILRIHQWGYPEIRYFAIISVII